MASRTAENSHGAVSVERGRTIREWAAGREPYLDDLKVILIAAIIATHAILGYAGSVVWWSYADVHEVTLSPVTEVALFVLAGPFALFMIALLFLIAGLLTPPAVERKGAGRFARDRLVRLGIPFAVFTLLLWPVLMYLLARTFGQVADSFWAEFVAQGSIDTGPLWFVGVLLIFSLGYAGWRRIRPRREAGQVQRWMGEISAGRLLILAGTVSIATFAVRLAFPVESERFLDLNFYEWPACLALFALGITASGRGWLGAVPDRLRRQSRTVALASVVAAAGLVATIGLLGLDEDDLGGGLHWPALVFAMVESALTVFGSVWLLGAAQRHLGRRHRFDPRLCRSAYGAFMLQGPILIGLAVALRLVPVPAEIKALLVAVAGIAGSFALAWLLISRIPVIGRVL